MRTSQLSIRDCGGYVVAALRGELDTTDAETAAVSVVALLDGRRQLIIDLETLDYLDCHAAGALLDVRKTARKAGGDVLLAAPQGLVHRLLALLDVGGVHASVAAAVASAGGRGAESCARGTR